MGPLDNNLNALPGEIADSVKNTTGQLEPAGTGQYTLNIDGRYLHSRQNPVKESSRMIEEVISPEEKIYLFFGAGLGYSVQQILRDAPRATVVWMEPFPGILHHAFNLYDYSEYIKAGRLKILVPPFHEDELFKSFKGLANLPVSFISHRGSLAWKKGEYEELRFIAERFFKKKDVNIATLSRFETIWTRNMVQNLPDIAEFAPVSSLFNIARGLPVIVCGAGPSLFNDLPLLYKYRSEYILIAVDTAVSVLKTGNIDPDLIYSVDPQDVNTKYLEAYDGNGKLVFDPTSSYHTLRLPQFRHGFVTSSPFPLLKLLTDHMRSAIGTVDFGGSVSTNAVSLAEAMGANVFITGQDLAFTNGYAHARGAVLEERLNLHESRFNRREKHNYRQLHWLPVKQIDGLRGKSHPTNEKMLIFRKWFSDRLTCKSWVNLTSDGGTIPGIKTGTLDEYFGSTKDVARVQEIKEKIRELAQKKIDLNRQAFTANLNEVVHELGNFKSALAEGTELSKTIYAMIQENKIDRPRLARLLERMTEIDEIASSKKGLNDLMGTSMQRVVLMITEGYDSTLSNEEKANEQLGSARKSILLYEGLLNACNLNRKLLKKALVRLGQA